LPTTGFPVPQAGWRYWNISHIKLHRNMIQGLCYIYIHRMKGPLKAFSKVNFRMGHEDENWNLTSSVQVFHFEFQGSPIQLFKH
jgi:hypothetical protein